MDPAIESDPFRAFLDTTVFHSQYLLDLILTAAEKQAFKVAWSDDVLDEPGYDGSNAKNGIVTDANRQAVTRLADEANKAFPDALVRRRRYQNLIVTTPALDPTDRHIIAAAISAQAGVIVTSDRRGFPDLTTNSGSTAKHQTRRAWPLAGPPIGDEKAGEGT